MQPLPFPSPEDLWGDYIVDEWSIFDNGRFGIHLLGISSNIIYSNQKTIDRVNSTIQNIITSAKEGLLSPAEACKEIHVRAIFSTEELQEIHQNASVQGKVMANFYKSQDGDRQ